MTIVIPNLTQQTAAVIILTRAECVYGNYGLTAALPRLITLLNARPADEAHARENAEKFRNILRELRAGDSNSAAITRLIYNDLGRLDETDNGWI